jgi:hypothetical protein
VVVRIGSRGLQTAAGLHRNRLHPVIEGSYVRVRRDPGTITKGMKGGLHLQSTDDTPRERQALVGGIIQGWV